VLWIRWPGQRTNVRHALADTATIQNWFGGLVDGMRDASGQMYLRNRYYDAASGQFTQPDPIGLAGGLNSYGVAAGGPGFLFRSLRSTGATIGVGYLLYRGVRLIPSLFPVLCPALRANLAVP
jgi:RHS repeat-associated protein